jgi:hypothetical protein
MNATADLHEYLDEIRQHVCSRCVECPLGGPPCTPLGKVCGVELHLPQLIEAVREVHSEWMGPYLENTHKKVCEHCEFLHHDCCPCPMDTLALLVVEAIETVEKRQQQRDKGRRLVESLPQADADIDDVLLAYKQAAGTWTGCDWPTVFGPAGLNLKDVSIAEAESLAVETACSPEGKSWMAAASWLMLVERYAQQAEREAALAVAAANAGAWDEAVKHASKAWGYEYYTGRPLRRAPTWQPLFHAIKTVAGKYGK